MNIEYYYSELVNFDANVWTILIRVIILSDDSLVVEPNRVDDAAGMIVPGRDLELGNFCLGRYVHDNCLIPSSEEDLLAVRRPRDGH